MLTAAKGTPMEQLVTLALFTGCRLSELLGLTWDCVDVDRGSLNICKQLNRTEHRAAAGLFLSPKNGKSRVITPAPSVLAALKEQRRRQAEMQLKAGAEWGNPHGLVFTSEKGGPLEHWTVEQRFSSLLKKAGLEGVRFHDLRHPNVKPETKNFYPFSEQIIYLIKSLFPQLHFEQSVCKFSITVSPPFAHGLI